MQFFREGVTFRMAAFRNKIPSGSLYRRTNHVITRFGRRPALGPSEEQTIVDMLIRIAYNGTLQTDQHLRKAFSVLIEPVIPARRLFLPSKNKRLSCFFLKWFRRCHKDKIKFAHPYYKNPFDSKKLIQRHWQRISRHWNGWWMTINSLLTVISTWTKQVSRTTVIKTRAVRRRWFSPDVIRAQPGYNSSGILI